MTIGTILQVGLYSMRCLGILNSVACCFTLPLSKAGQLIQQWVASSSFWAGAGWWAARVIGRESSEGPMAKVDKSMSNIKVDCWWLLGTEQNTQKCCLVG